MIGTELLLGQIEDTNATFIARILAEHGIHLFQKTTVGDNQDRICAALDAALSRADVVLCSGGLGPTEDDITRECVAAVLGRPLEYRPALFEQIAARFAHYRIKIPENNKRQVTLPQGAIAVNNPHGTAPGVILEDPRGVVVLMPGVPAELKPMLHDEILPFLKQKFGLQGTIVSRVLHVCGVGESRVDELIGDLVRSQRNPTVGLLASPHSVRIRIAAHAEDREAALRLIAPLEALLRQRLPDMVMGVDADTLESVLDQLLLERGWRLRLVETGTGGVISQRFVACAAASFAGGVVLAPGQAPHPSPETALDAACRTLIDSPDNCALALLADREARRTYVAFKSPGGHAQWDVPDAGSNERGQIRTAILALERLRRHLAGYAVVASGG